LVVVVEQAPTEQTQALLELVCLLQQSVVVMVVGQVQVAAQAAAVAHLGLAMAAVLELQAKVMRVELTQLLLVTRLVVAEAQGLSVLTVLQELLLKLVMVALDCNLLLRVPLFIMLAVAAGAVLIPADCCLTPALVEQVEVVTAVLVLAVLELTELQIQAVVLAALRRAVQHLHREVLVWLLSLVRLLRFQPQVLQQLPIQVVSIATRLLATVLLHSKVKHGTFCKT